MSLLYKTQALEARLKRIERNTVSIASFPEFNYNAYGACQDLQAMEEGEILVSGQTGTGKTFACLAKIHNICLNTPHVRVLVVRKTRASMAESTLKTFESGILGPGHPLLSGATRVNRKAYVYPNGARIVIMGMDNPGRIMSSDYDLVYVNEAFELSTDEWELLTTRLRNNVLHFQSIIADTNPQSEAHWLWRRHLENKLTLLNSQLDNNPEFWSPEEGWSERGLKYIEKLKALSGVRYKRLYLAEWASAENAVFEAYDPQRHVIYGDLPRFTDYWTGVDWGFKHPGAMLTFGRTQSNELILVDEILRTQQTPEWWVQQAKVINSIYHPKKFVCDPAEPGQIQSLIVQGLPAIKANNKIRFGLGLVNERLGTDTIKFHNNSLKHPDPLLQMDKKPIRLVDELPGYVWDGTKELPIAHEDDACAAMRYVVAHVDRPVTIDTPATSVSIPQFGR